MTGSPAYTVTNFNTVADSPTYKAQLDANSQVLKQLGAWFAPQPSSPAAMTVTVNAGSLFVGGAIVTQTAQTTGTITAPSGSNKRIDRVVIDGTTGAVSVITGTPTTGTPSAPAITAGKLPCAQIGPLLSSTTTIGTSLVIDERVPPAVSIATKSDMQTGTDNTKQVTPARTNDHDGVAKAWASWHWTGAAIVIDASFNVSSITRSGTGDYTINFTTAFATANYCVAGGAGEANATNVRFLSAPWGTQAVGSCRVIATDSSGVGADVAHANCAFFGRQ